jgi:hypothetical protein
VQPSTTSTVATITETATQPTNYQTDCPATLYTSNTTNNKHNSSSKSYLVRTPNPSSTTDMVIDDTKTLQAYTLGSTPSRRFLRKKSDSPAPLLSSPANTTPTETTVPPLKPFILGSSKLNMSSINTAVSTLNESTTADQSDITNNEKIYTISHSSMEIANVSTLFKQKSIFNPYAKQQRTKTSDHHSTPTTDTNTANKSETSTDSLQQLLYVSTDTTNTSANDTPPLIPTTKHINVSLQYSRELKKTQNTSNQQLQELSQEEAEYISNKLTKQEQQ